MEPVPSTDENEEHLPEQPFDNDATKLNLWQGVALLTADCLGVGVLALPYDAYKLGWTFGLSFLIINFPINYVAGNYLSVIALDLESDTSDDKGNEPSLHGDHIDVEVEMQENQVHRRKSRKKYSEVPSLSPTSAEESMVHEDVFNDEDVGEEDQLEQPEHDDHVATSHHSKLSSTYDLISISDQVFSGPQAAGLVALLYYTNIFLVLGDYLLVMSRAVSAMFLDDICLPIAGIIASVLMFAICQLKTMANLGRKVSVVSLLAMVIVLGQCLFHHRTSGDSAVPINVAERESTSVWQKLSALASIAFAVGSQKLFLNIRHELKDRKQASKTLAWSLTSYGATYLLVILFAGPHPPSFLFDAIPEGMSRRIAGLLLWGHVAVSYAINCQALCSSIDRAIVSRYPVVAHDHSKRWLGLTLTICISSYVVANAIPFFKDLVALIGALTSIPLTLMLPALLHQKYSNLRLWLPRIGSWSGSYPLLLFSLVFFVVGLLGALSSIDQDWLNHGKPFSCH